MLPLVLTSSSPYRQAILNKLQLPFQIFSLNIKESSLPGEPAFELVKRLSLEKARAGIAVYPNALLIGSDQVCVIEEKIIGKPKTFEKAQQQLRSASGKKVTFYTGLTLLNSKTGRTQTQVETFNVYFRTLSDEEIKHYLEKEKPFDCAGSFKSEGLGIALFEKLEGRDPNALVGLPLILLCEMLRVEKHAVLG